MYEGKYFSLLKNSKSINVWKSNWIDNFSVISESNSVNDSSSAKAKEVNTGRLSVKFSGNYMKQTKVVYPHLSVINIYIVYELEERIVSSYDFIAQCCLFVTVKVTKV